VITNFTKMLKRIIGEDIQLSCQYAAHLPFVHADLGMLEQVLANLVVNARDAMPKGGQLVLATMAARLDAAEAKARPEAKAGEFVCLSVADTGTGIAPEHLPHIFEPFFTTKDVGKGTGLGLATVYGIVQQHQGWVEVSSQPGAGSTFRVFLPATPPPPVRPSPAAAVSAKPPGGSETILLVEDDDAVRALTGRILKNFGYHVREASSGPEALESWQLHQQEIALLLTDMIMPEHLSGRELIERLVSERPGLKVILMSGYNGETGSHDTSFLRRTGTCFLQKPCDAHTLLRAVRRCLDDKAEALATGNTPASAS
jgi:CheY-like chemotaxis protein